MWILEYRHNKTINNNSKQITRPSPRPKCKEWKRLCLQMEVHHVIEVLLAIPRLIFIDTGLWWNARHALGLFIADCRRL
jgi:hypothetical protein